MKKILIYSIISFTSIVCFVLLNTNKGLESIAMIEKVEYITLEDDKLNVYDTIHKLTHSFLDIDKNNLEIIAPTKEAREKVFNLVDSEIYMKDNMDIYEKVGFRVEKLYYGIIDEDIIELHNIVSEEYGDSHCNALGLNYEAINKIVNNDKFFNDIDRENYLKRLKELNK